MIGRLSGIVLEKNPPQILFDVQGVGYEVEVPMSTFYNLPGINEKTVLHTQLIIREDAHLLFGFGTLDERTTFRELLKISGVGPKMALAVLSGLSLADLADAIARKETGRLVKIPGVGKKTAERLILELQGKFVAVPVAAGKAGTHAANSSDILNALQALGYSEKEASAAIQHLPADIGVSDGIRQALKLLSKA